MPDRARPTLCPIMRELIALVARQARRNRALGQDRVIDRLAHLEAEAVRTYAPSRTLDAIHARRREIRIEGLMSGSRGLRGH